MCKAYTSCWLVVPRHQTSAASLREIIFDVIKKLLSCCGWYTSHKAVTSIQPNAPPWISLLTPCTALKDACSIYVIWPELFVSAHYARHKPFLSIPLWLYFLNTPPPNQSRILLSPSSPFCLLLPVHSTKAFLCQICWPVTDKQLQ